MSQEFLFFKPGTSNEELRDIEKVVDTKMESSSGKEDTLEILESQLNVLLADFVLVETKLALHLSASDYQKNIENDGDTLIATFEEDKNTFNKFLKKELVLNAPEKYYLQQKLVEATKRGQKLAQEIDLNAKFMNEEEYQNLLKEKENLLKRIEGLESLID